jgi:hypothetical protein
MDKGVAGREDTIEADCEDVKGGRRERGFDVGIAKRTVFKDRMDWDLVPLTLTCRASIPDDSCGGEVRLEFRGTRMGSTDYVLAKGRRGKESIALGSGSVAIGSVYRRAYTAMKAAARRGGAPVKVVVTTGSSTFTHRVTLSRVTR